MRALGVAVVILATALVVHAMPLGESIDNSSKYMAHSAAAAAAADTSAQCHGLPCVPNPKAATHSVMTCSHQQLLCC
jgi:hypothetical protein